VGGVPARSLWCVLAVQGGVRLTRCTAQYCTLLTAAACEAGTANRWFVWGGGGVG
jgi:hypothetical protein